MRMHQRNVPPFRLHRSDLFTLLMLVGVPLLSLGSIMATLIDVTILLLFFGLGMVLTVALVRGHYGSRRKRRILA